MLTIASDLRQISVYSFLPSVTHIGCGGWPTMCSCCFSGIPHIEIATSCADIDEDWGADECEASEHAPLVSSRASSHTSLGIKSELKCKCPGV